MRFASPRHIRASATSAPSAQLPRSVHPSRATPVLPIFFCLPFDLLPFPSSSPTHSHFDSSFVYHLCIPRSFIYSLSSPSLWRLVFRHSLCCRQSEANQTTPLQPPPSRAATSSPNAWTDIESGLAATNRFVLNAAAQRLSSHKIEHGHHRAASHPPLE